MDQLDIAIHQTAHGKHGDLTDLARKMGMHAQLLRNKTCATTDTHKLNLREAIAMMELTGNDSILEVMAEMRGYMLARKELPDAQSIINAVLADDIEHGDVARTIRDAIADGKLTEAERADIARHISKAHATLDALKSTVLHAPTLLKQV